MPNLLQLRRRWPRVPVYALLGAAALASARQFDENEGPSNGFDLSGAQVPVGEIHQGGPPRDGIPALTLPARIPGPRAEFLGPDERVLGVEISGQARAYPIKILNLHEIVNDELAGVPIVVTYCPLCGSGVVFSATVEGQVLEFGVSGLLYNSDVLLYDRATESLWSQLLARAVSGPLVGSELRLVVASHTTWRQWRAQHPQTEVIAPRFGLMRGAYDTNPYAGYEQSPNTWFPVSHSDSRYQPKELVLGLSMGGIAKAYPLFELEIGGASRTDQIAGHTIEIQFDADARSARVLDDQGREVPSITLYWFAWVAFHPDTLVFDPD